MSEYQPVSSSGLSDIGQRCPKCHQPRMILSKVESGPNGSDYRTFECQYCGRIHTLIVSSDPMESGIHGLLNEEFKPALQGVGDEALSNLTSWDAMVDQPKEKS